ncbi:hypothetical protein FRC06_000888 [Ceratobasidium sp. 370]|nr:hypothetical protein FRC06_000888 [Ceratobasidium sp. 370]
MAQPQPPARATLDVFDTTPLFMRELPSDNDTFESDNNTLAALQSLIHEGSPEEVASNFKDQGNEYFKGRRFREAMGFYTQGIDALTTQSTEGQGSTIKRTPVQEKDRPLYNALLLNRAAANLELGSVSSKNRRRKLLTNRRRIENFGRVLRDAHLVLEHDPRSSKALFRAARALIKLGRFEEAADACDRCLAFDPENKDVKAMKDLAVKGIEEQTRKAIEKAQAAERDKAIKAALDTALKYHSIAIPRTPGDEIDPESLPHLDPPLPTDPATAELICRVALVYPQHGQTDLIIRFSTHDTLGAHLDSILPDPSSPDGQLEFPPWDTKREYSSRAVNVYVRTRQGRVLKLGRNKTLAEICANVRKTGKERGIEDGLVVGQGVIAFVVVPRGSDAEERYIRSVKEEKAAQ